MTEEHHRWSGMANKGLEYKATENRVPRPGLEPGTL